MHFVRQRAASVSGSCTGSSVLSVPTPWARMWNVKVSKKKHSPGLGFPLRRLRSSDKK